MFIMCAVATYTHASLFTRQAAMSSQFLSTQEAKLKSLIEEAESHLDSSTSMCSPLCCTLQLDSM